ncbi:MAG: cation:proton antiporter [Candidatus Odinarchaeota archaeon]
MDNTLIIYTVALIIFAGILAARAADIYKFPKMTPLILTGLLLTVIGFLINLEIEIQEIRDVTLLIAELALIIVLYKEGMHLDLSLLKRNILPISVLAILCTFLTAVLVGVEIALFHFVPINFIAALLVGSILAPTDPSATFSILRGRGTRIKERIEIILGGESALNDIIAIMLVFFVFVPRMIAGGGELQLSPDTIIQGLWASIGGLLLGAVVGGILVYIISLVKDKSEISFISLAGAFLIFAISEPLGVSSAMAALVCGVVLTNPEQFRIHVIFPRTHLYNFWDDVTFLFEIIAFIFIGFLLDVDEFPQFIVLGVLLSVVIIITRIMAVFITTFPFELGKSTATILSNKERLFIGLAGFKGLTTAILALFAYVNLEAVNQPLAQVVLYASLIVILITGTFQGLILTPLSKNTGVIEEISELDELRVKKLVLETELEKLLSDRSEKKINAINFRKLSLPLKEELYLVEERLQTLIAQESAQKEFLEYQLELYRMSLEVLEENRITGEISGLALDKMESKLKKEIANIEAGLAKLSDIMKMEETPPSAEKIELMIAEDTIKTLSKDPKLSQKHPELVQVQKVLRKVVNQLSYRKITKKQTETVSKGSSTDLTTSSSQKGNGE